MKTFFIHLMDNPERKRNIDEQIKQHGLTDYKITPAVLGNMFNPENPVLGSLTSHNRILTDIIFNEIDGPVLILEDDAMLLNNFLVNLGNKLVNLPADWDIAFIGYNLQGHNLFNTTIPGWFTRQSAYSNITFSGGWAYLVNGHWAARKILPLMNDVNTPFYPYHDLMLRSYIDSGKLTAYWLCHRLVNHGTLPSVMRSSERFESDFLNG